jgi:putative transposase
MLLLEFKVKAKPHQYQAINEAIPIAQFIQNKCLRYWMNNKGVNKYDINKQCTILAKDFDLASKLNSMARQSSAERAWSAITRFYNNCQKKVKGKKGFPKFKKNCPSVEYKTTGWQLDESNRKAITITDKTGIGRLKLIGTYDLNFYSLDHIKLQKSVSKKFKKGPALSLSKGQPPSNNYKNFLTVNILLIEMKMQRSISCP